MNSPDFKEYALFAEQLADQARGVSLKYFRKKLDIDIKSDESPVTIADRETEQRVREMIREQYPQHGFFGEESGSANVDSPFTWVVDPIDGTKNFVAGMPFYGTLIALLKDGQPVVGVIDIPALNERWVGVQGEPTRFNGTAVVAKADSEFEQAIWYTTSPAFFTGEDGVAFGRLESSLPACRFGTDCYAFALLAAGYVDLVIETQLKPYDYLALVPVIEGAGGMITDWQGQRLGLDSEGQVLACANADVHARALALVSD
ncbi:histidinol-phosphatase [Marinobacterium marinum]|uniref:Histidinol-phosphatase n=1 Tax=Marinobacterium marinum TaxID=2756129 RepID=A0A7W1WW65_9GAMM|nr:histidinol-phosphatase [Marinobacterium marinum]MBA4501350.1 histidinol-phosphatase [Marinobacterium marinum]